MIVVAVSRPVQAVSDPVIDARIFGIELCPQFICGAAIFSGVVAGQVGNNPRAFGTFAVAIIHEDLPDPGQEAAIVDGVFEIRVRLQRIRGVVSDGTLTNNGDNTFTVEAVLTIAGGGGEAFFCGTLDHRGFPTISGTIAQVPGCIP